MKALARDITNNLRYEQPAALDLTGNKSSAFATNTYGSAPQGLLQGLRSYTVLVSINAKSLAGQPRIYDFGSASGNSLFLRANSLAAGIKLNGGTTTMVNSNTQLYKQAGNSIVKNVLVALIGQMFSGYEDRYKEETENE